MSDQFPHGYMCSCTDCQSYREYERSLEEREEEMSYRMRDMGFLRNVEWGELSTDALHEIAELVCAKQAQEEVKDE